MSETIKEGKILIDYYVKSYESTHGNKPLINRNTAKWAARDLIDSFGLHESQRAVDWYFYVKDSGHDWIWYTNNVEKLISARKQKEDDDKARKVAREKARVWLSE
jgi:predicted AAA+ superfamily ATPase